MDEKTWKLKLIQFQLKLTLSVLYFCDGISDRASHFLEVFQELAFL